MVADGEVGGEHRGGEFAAVDAVADELVSPGARREIGGIFLLWEREGGKGKGKRKGGFTVLTRSSPSMDCVRRFGIGC